MLRKVKLVIKYWGMVQQILEFAEVAVKATADGKITQKEKSALMKEFWDIINTAKAIRK
jgi:isochorismate hydrolase